MRHRGEKSTRASRLPGLAVLSHSTPNQPSRPYIYIGRACSFPELLSGQRDRARLKSSRLRLRPTYAATLVKRTVLTATTASNCRVSGCGLDASHHMIDLRHLGPSGAAVGPCHRSVEAAVSGAVSSTRERVQICDALSKEGPLGMLMLRHPSRWLARAMAGRSPCHTREIVVCWLLILFSSPQDDAQRPHVEERGARTSWRQPPGHELWILRWG